MKTALRALAVATMFLAPRLSSAQSATAPVTPCVLGIEQSDGELSPAVQLYDARGDEMTGQMHFAAAARAYRRAADLARQEGHLPSWTTWQLANAYYNDGNLVAAAAALDQLANEAGLVGELQVEGLAIYYAAWLNGKAGRKTEAAAGVARLEALLRSPYMPIATRDRLSSWVRTSKEVAVN